MPTLDAPPPAAPDVDRTALHNFAALRGQLRVSFTPRCNIACWFCHNEGDVPPPLTRLDRSRQPRARRLDADGYVTLVTALMAVGLKRVYFTGGEPLTSPLARPVLERLPAPAADASYTLITNGTRVRACQAWLARTHVEKLKVSLHYLSDASLEAVAGTRLGIAAVLDGIEAAREVFERVELNTLLPAENTHEIPAILDFALGTALAAPYRPVDSGQKGPLLVIEGVSGSGKSTLVRLLRETLNATEVHTLPGPHRRLSPPVNAQTRALPQLAFYLSGVLHASDVIRDARTRGLVIADRYVNSVIANHAGVHDLPLDDVLTFIEPFRPYLLQPHRTFYLRVSPPVLRTRLAAKPDYTASDHDILHIPGQLERIQANYQTLATTDPSAVLLDADESTPEQLAATILALTGTTARA